MESQALADPILVAPRLEERMSPDSITLRWEPTAGAERYTVEVAADTAFESMVVSTDAGSDTEITLAGVFAADRTTYFWRVFAHAGDASSRGERVESFRVEDKAELRAEEAHGAPARLDGGEGAGPAAHLFASAAQTALHEAGVRHDDAWADELTAEGVEPEGMEAGQILGIAVAVLVSLFVISFIVYNWKGTVQDKAEFAVSSSAINPDPNVARYPVLAQADANAANALDGYEVLDAASGTYRIPIDQAIQIMANEYVQHADSVAGLGAALAAPSR